MNRYLLAVALAMATTGAVAQTSAQIHQDFTARQVEMKSAGIEDQLSQTELSAECRNALEFLYAYMPWPDVADYSTDFYTAQVQCALQARKEMPWGAKVPDREWLHFVLPLRVNNENLDEFRTTCYDELKERVKGLSMAEAVMEVNHWCHEHVTYKPSDARTSSPLASMKTATGRCGEESTFTVAALRAVGIPARQVYTPRWAHTDDNHAWVEAWVDGKWHFLGACEPEAVLDLGWFNQPASRGMLMHTKVFGRYDGPEDVIDRTDCYTEINVTANYARTARTTVTVCDASGKPAAGADVAFKIYNYGELYTVQHAKADNSGKASILTGLGDMVVWASKDGHYGVAQFTGGRNADVSLQLKYKAGDAFSQELTLVPPAATDNVPAVSPEAAARNKVRLAQEDSIRTAYVHTFATQEMTDSVCAELGIDDAARVHALVKKACGNWQSVYDVVESFPRTETLDLLESLTDKDLRDFAPEVIQDHLQFVIPEDGDGGDIVDGELDENGNPIDGGEASEATTQPKAADLTAEQREFQIRYVQCPRIANEMLTGWRSYFSGAFKPSELKDYHKDPTKFVKWIDKNITSNPERNPQGYCLSPSQAMETHRADVRNKGILFVAAMRSIGVPARIDEVTGKVQFAKMDAAQTMPTEKSVQWQTVRFADEKEESRNADATATLKLNYTPREHMENPGYYYHFTLSRLAGAQPVLQNYPETATWTSTFKNGTQVDAGDYVLTSGTRLADGTVLANVSVFPVAAGTTTTQKLVMREDKEAPTVIGSFNAENLYTDCASGKTKSVLSTTGRGYYALALARANHEPTNHVLHDMEKVRKELEAWGRPILVVFPSQDEYERFQKNSAEFTNLPSTLSFGVDTEGQVKADLFGGALTKSEEMPMVVLADTFNRVVFTSQGYTIGLGERLVKTAAKLK